jgi:hypothetical protein
LLSERWLQASKEIEGQITTNLVEELLSLYQTLGCNMAMKIHFLSSHLEFFLENCGSVSDEYDERFHQDTAAMEGRYKLKWSASILADY